MQAAASTHARQHFLPPSSPSSFPKLNQMGFSISLSLSLSLQSSHIAASSASPAPSCASAGQQAMRILLKGSTRAVIEMAPASQWEENPPDPLAQKSCTTVQGCLNPWSTSFSVHGAELLPIPPNLRKKHALVITCSVGKATCRKSSSLAPSGRSIFWKQTYCKMVDRHAEVFGRHCSGLKPFYLLLPATQPWD